MSAIGRRLALPGRRLGPRPAAVAAPPGPPPPSDAERELLERRERLSRELAELQFDLGGLTYEMAIRDHFRMDVLVRHAARLQQVDSELGEIERLAHMEESGAAGNCPSCKALYGRGAVFCWQCGTTLMDRTSVGPAANGTAASGPAAPPSAFTPPPPTQSDERSNGDGSMAPGDGADAEHADGTAGQQSSRFSRPAEPAGGPHPATETQAGNRPRSFDGPQSPAEPQSPANP